MLALTGYQAERAASTLASRLGRTAEARESGIEYLRPGTCAFTSPMSSHLWPYLRACGESGVTGVGQCHGEQASILVRKWRVAHWSSAT